MPYDERDLAFCDGYFNRGHCASLKEFQACFLGQTRRRDDDRQKVERRNQAEWAQIRRKVEKLPPLPDERNPLLGRWRVEGAIQP